LEHFIQVDNGIPIDSWFDDSHDRHLLQVYLQNI